MEKFLPSVKSSQCQRSARSITKPRTINRLARFLIALRCFTRRYVFLLFMGATAIPLVSANFRQIFIFLVQIDLCLSLAIWFVPKDMIIDKSLFASFSLHRTQFANPISGFTKMSKLFFSSRLK